MSRIKEKFNELEKRNEKALISYIMLGFPNEKATMSTIRGLVKGGVDIIEIGFPFSDPLADGPVIQNASTISLQKGTNVAKFFSIVKKIRKETEIPLILMTYTNILHRMGYEKFIKDAKKAGVDGFILPDMSIEESKDYLKAAKNNADTIFLISPISSIVISSFPDTINNNTFLAPVILLSFKRGESKAFIIASWALLFPDDTADPIIAVPLLLSTVLASRKSIFWV